MNTDCFALEDLIFRLRKIEFIKEEMQWQLEHQYTNQHILLAIVNGAGDLTIEKHHFRFKENKGYWIPPEFPFELTADSPEALPRSGGAEKFLLFIEQELKPKVNHRPIERWQS